MLNLNISRSLAGIAVLLATFAAAAAPSDVTPSEDFNAELESSAVALQGWYNDKGLWTTTDWWNAANCVEAMEDVMVANNGQKYLPVLGNTFEHNSHSNFLNEFYDDEGWWALAWIRAYDLTGQDRFLRMARVIFKDMAGGWNDHCGGGIWWKKNNHYVNAIANELFLLVAVRLHQRTPGDAGAGSYLDWAKREWVWFKQTGMINSENLVNDGLNRNCQNNRRTTWTYNQGVILGGLTDLYKSTGEIEYLNQAIAMADAATRTLVDKNGILMEPCESGDCHGGDVPQFKGIFIRYLAYLYDETHKPEYGEFLLRNARSVWSNDRDDANHLGLRWTGPFDKADAARHSSAMFALGAVAEPTTLRQPFAKDARSWTPANLVHEVGRLDGHNNWAADSLRDRASGILCAGAEADDLAAGTRVAAFELRVDNFNGDDSVVATISIVETPSGKIVATKDLKRHQFPNTLFQTFTLPFKAKAGRHYDFRTFWHCSPDAPRLTQRSVFVESTEKLKKD